MPKTSESFDRWFASRQMSLKPFPIPPSAYYSEEEWVTALWKWWLDRK